MCFQQSQPLASEAALEEKLHQAQRDNAGKPIEKPPRWGGLRVIPRSIEFLTFRENRLHLREYYTRSGQQSDWEKQLLQP
ncbi:pyridoxine 5'-phosphate oxidase C-terminal domain-containing protein [Erwinia oleae]|uniref:pyridoxine 5'-phosphate oxidase C-terminal domain-containing protein n=1 Tax=Erwinia oleae TaxID=796334 RepID=UPI000689723C